MDLRIRSDGSWSAGKLDWLATRKGFDTCRSCTLDLGLFAAAHCENGFIPSGTVLGKVTASGLYGPYVTGAATGAEVAVGFLLNDVPMASGDTHEMGAQYLWEGVVISDKLPAFTGTTDGELDAGARVDLAMVKFETFAG